MHVHVALEIKRSPIYFNIHCIWVILLVHVNIERRGIESSYHPAWIPAQTYWCASPELSGSVLQVDARGQNFLHQSVLAQDVEAVIFLLSVRADVNSKAQNPTLNTTLHFAVKSGSEILVRHLVSSDPPLSVAL